MRPLINVQLGHCFRTRGATGTAGEQALVHAVGEEMRRLAHTHGLRVNLLLADDPVPWGNAFVALHADGSVNTAARGASCGYRTPEGGHYGGLWKIEHQRAGYPAGFRPDNYTPGLRSYYGHGRAVAAGTRAAAIVELGFLTNASDRAWLTNGENVTRMARALLRASAQQVGVPVDNPSPEPEPPEEEEEEVAAYRAIQFKGQSRVWLVDQVNGTGWACRTVDDLRAAVRAGQVAPRPGTVRAQGIADVLEVTIPESMDYYMALQRIVPGSDGWSPVVQTTS